MGITASAVAPGTVSGHSERMSDREFWWCLRHRRVESGDDVCPAQYRLGPYPSAEEATRALDTVDRRNAEWEAEDARWHGEKP